MGRDASPTRLRGCKTATKRHVPLSAMLEQAIFVALQIDRRQLHKLLMILK